MSSPPKKWQEGTLYKLWKERKQPDGYGGYDFGCTCGGPAILGFAGLVKCVRDLDGCGQEGFEIMIPEQMDNKKEVNKNE